MRSEEEKIERISKKAKELRLKNKEAAIASEQTKVEELDSKGALQIKNF